MAANNETQMVGSQSHRFPGIIVSNGRQPSIKFIHLIIASFCIKSRKSHAVLLTALADSLIS